MATLSLINFFVKEIGLFSCRLVRRLDFADFNIVVSFNLVSWFLLWAKGQDYFIGLAVCCLREALDF